MRLYTFGNFYLSSIQQGIQTAHVVAELFTKYADPAVSYTCREMKIGRDLLRWAIEHKTIVCLNGGTHYDLADMMNWLQDSRCDFPFAGFTENRESLNNAWTSIGIIVPEWLYGRPQRSQYASQEDFDTAYLTWMNINDPTPFALELADLLNASSLAR